VHLISPKQNRMSMLILQSFQRKSCTSEKWLTHTFDCISTFLCEKGGAKSTLPPKALCLRTGARTGML